MWKSHGLGVYGQKGLLSLNDDCLVIVASFLPIESATSLGLTCKTLSNVILSEKQSEGLWQRIVRDLWTKRWLAQELRDSFHQTSWKRSARVVALFMTIIGQWQQLSNPGSQDLISILINKGTRRDTVDCATRATEYIPEHNPLKPIPVPQEELAPFGSPHWDRKKNPSVSENFLGPRMPQTPQKDASPTSQLSSLLNRIPIYSTPTSSPLDSERSAPGSAPVAAPVAAPVPTVEVPTVEVPNKVPWHVTQMNLVTRFLRNYTLDEKSKEEQVEFRTLALSVHLWHLMVLQCAPRMRKFIGEVHLAPLNPDRTTATMRSEMPLMYWQSMAFFLNLFGQQGPEASLSVSIVSPRSQNMGPVVGLVLPHLIKAALILLRHTHPSTIDPVRDGASELLFRISVFFPEFLNIDKVSDNHDKLISFLAQFGYSLRKILGHRVPVLRNISDLKLSELVPTKKFKQRLLHTLSRFVSRSMRHNVWNHIEETLRIDRKRDEYIWRQYQSLTEEDEAFRFICEKTSKLPLDVTEALIVSSSYALRDRTDPSIDFGGHRHNGFADPFAEMNENNNGEDNDENGNNNAFPRLQPANDWNEDENDDDDEDDDDDEENEDDFEHWADNEEEEEGEENEDDYDDNDDDDDEDEDDNQEWDDYYYGASDDELNSSRNPLNSSHVHRSMRGGAGRRNNDPPLAWPAPGPLSPHRSHRANKNPYKDSYDLPGSRGKQEDPKDPNVDINDRNFKAFIRDFVLSTATLRAIHLIKPVETDEIIHECDPYEIMKAWVASSTRRFVDRVQLGLELPIFGSTNTVFTNISNQFDRFDDDPNSYSSSSEHEAVLHSLENPSELSDITKAGGIIHSFLSSSDWGCGLPADRDEAPDLCSLFPSFTVENMIKWSRSRFFVFTSLSRSIAIAPEDRLISENERRLRIEQVKRAKSLARDYAERKECSSTPSYPLDLEPSLTGAFYVSDILPRSAAWSLSRSAPLIVIGMQAYARRMIAGKLSTGTTFSSSSSSSQIGIQEEYAKEYTSAVDTSTFFNSNADLFHPALKRPLLSDPNTLKLWGMGQIISTQRPTEGRSLKKKGTMWDRWGIIPPKWLLNDAAMVGAICSLLGGYLGILSPLTDANLINKMLSAVSPLLLPEAADDVGPIFGLTDLLERLITISALPSLRKASRVHILITDLINLVVYDRPQILAASGRSAELYLLGMRGIQARIAPAVRDEEIRAVALYEGGIGKSLEEKRIERISRNARPNAPTPFFTSFITNSNMIHSCIGFIDVFLGSISCVLDLQIAHEHLAVGDAVFKIPGPDMHSDGGISIDRSMSAQVQSIQRGLRDPSGRSYTEYFDPTTGSRSVLLGHQDLPLTPENGRAFNGTPAVDLSEQTAPRFFGQTPAPPPHPTTLSPELYKHILKWLDELEALALRYTEVFFSLLIGEWHTDVEDRRQGAVIRPDMTANRITRHVAACLLGGFRSKDEYIWDFSIPDFVNGFTDERNDRKEKSTQRDTYISQRRQEFEKRIRRMERMRASKTKTQGIKFGFSSRVKSQSENNEDDDDDHNNNEDEEDDEGNDHNEDNHDQFDLDDLNENLWTDPSYVFLQPFLPFPEKDQHFSYKNDSPDVYEFLESWKRIRSVISSLVKVGVDSNNRFEQMQPVPPELENIANQQNGDPRGNLPLGNPAVPRGDDDEVFHDNAAVPLANAALPPPPPLPAIPRRVPPPLTKLEIHEKINHLVLSWETIKKSLPADFNDLTLREIDVVYPFAQLATRQILTTIAKEGIKDEVFSNHASLVIGVEQCLNSITQIDMTSKSLLTFLNLGPPDQIMDEDEHGDPIASMDQLYQTMNLLTRVCTLRSLLVKWVPPESPSSLPFTIPITPESPSWGLDGKGVEHLRTLIQTEPFDGVERWSRVATIAVSFLLFADVSANPNLDEDEETEYSRDMPLPDYSVPKPQLYAVIDMGQEPQFKEDRKRYSVITGVAEDQDPHLPSLLISNDIAANIPNQVPNDDSDDAMPALIRENDEPNENENDDEDDDENFPDDWSDDMFLTQALPHLSSAGFDLLGVLVRHIPVQTALAAIKFVGVHTMVRLALTRVNILCSKVCLHSFFYFVAECASGRIPLLTIKLGRRLLTGHTWDRENWFLFIKHSMLSMPSTGTAAYIQLCVALVRILTQICLKQNEWCVLIGNDPKTLAGFVPMLESIENPDSPVFRSAVAQDVLISGEEARARWTFPRRLNEKEDFRVPPFLLEKPNERLWFNVRGKDEPTYGKNIKQSNFDLFSRSNLCEDETDFNHLSVPQDAPFLEHLISLILSGICSPFVVKHVRNLDLSDEAWRCLLTGTARLIRVYHQSVSSATHGDRIWQKFHSALIRVGGIVEVIKLGWTSLIPPHILSAKKISEMKKANEESIYSAFFSSPISQIAPPLLSELSTSTNYSRQLVKFSKALGPTCMTSGMDAVMMRSYSIAKKFNMHQSGDIFNFKQAGAEFERKEREGFYRTNAKAREIDFFLVRDTFSFLANSAIADAIELRTQEVSCFVHEDPPESLDTSWGRFTPLRVLSPDSQMDTLMRIIDLDNHNIDDDASRKMIKSLIKKRKDKDKDKIVTDDAFLTFCTPPKKSKTKEGAKQNQEDDEQNNDEKVSDLLNTEDCIAIQLRKFCKTNEVVTKALVTRALLLGCSPRLQYIMSNTEKRAIEFATSFLSSRINPLHFASKHSGSHNTRLFVTNFVKAWLFVHTLSTCPSPRSQLPLLSSQFGSSESYPLISNASVSVSHLFRLSVVEDSSQIHSSYPKHVPQYEEDPLGAENHVETRNVGECVQDGRRWLAFLLWTWRLAEVGEETLSEM
jgi:hypothetical protein